MEIGPFRQLLGQHDPGVARSHQQNPAVRHRDIATVTPAVAIVKLDPPQPPDTQQPHVGNRGVGDDHSEGDAQGV